MDFSNYRNLYSLQKTIRFELKPVGKTLKNIQLEGVIEKDEKKYNDSFKIKKLLDEYVNDNIKM